MRPRFSISLISEDGERSWHGLKAILEKVLQRYEDDGFTPRVEVVPTGPSIRRIAGGNRWRSGDPRDAAEKRDLWRYIARKISEPGGFVVFHYDGDTRWSTRTESPARAQFERELRSRVAQVISGSRLPPAEVSHRMKRVVECVPFYSVEAWTYQATERAKALCQERYGGKDVARFNRWAANPSDLDEELKPKDATCLGGNHNDDLGRHVRVWPVAQLGCSLTWFLWSLHASPELLDALAVPP